MSKFQPSQFTILVVDDVPQNLNIIIEILEHNEYQTTFANSGKEALMRLKVVDPDLILLDLMMPEMDGLEVCKIIKSEPRYQDIPIIFLTANYEINNIIKAFELGAADYVTKPFNAYELLSRVKTHLKIKQQAKQLEEINQSLKQSEAKLNTIITHLYDGVLIVNHQGIVLFANPAAARMFNKSLSELLNQEIGIPFVLGKTTEIQIVRSEEELGFAEITMVETQWQDENVYLISLRDITEKRNIENNLEKVIEKQRDLTEKLEKTVITDPLTGVLNRQRILEIFAQEFKRYLQYEEPYSILLFDVDGMQTINNNYSHDIGDQILNRIAQRMIKSARDIDRIGRLGADQFLILLPDKNHRQAKEEAENLRVSISESPFKVKDEMILVKASIGVGTYQKQDQNFENLLQRASEALKTSKLHGGNQVHLDYNNY